MRLWSELLSHNITPTPAAYLAIMQPLAQRGRGREVTKMINDMSSRGVRVSVLAYTVQAQAFIVEGSLARAVAVLDDMATHRVKPDEKVRLSCSHTHICTLLLLDPAHLFPLPFFLFFFFNCSASSCACMDAYDLKTSIASS